MNVVLRAEAPIGHIESEGDYQQITLILDRLLDVVRDDGTHPLYSLVTLIGDLLEAYEANLEPEMLQPQAYHPINPSTVSQVEVCDNSLANSANRINF
jgi:HTH-type transcriptional regulator/antitoxin HigA